jgi:hypothetical protein
MRKVLVSLAASILLFTSNSNIFLLYIPNQRKLYRGVDKSLAPTFFPMYFV